MIGQWEVELPTDSAVDRAVGFKGCKHVLIIKREPAASSGEIGELTGFHKWFTESDGTLLGSITDLVVGTSERRKLFAFQVDGSCATMKRCCFGEFLASNMRVELCPDDPEALLLTDVDWPDSTIKLRRRSGE